MSASLSPTPRTRPTRGKERAVTERAQLHNFLREALVAHLGVSVGGRPVVLPTAYGLDLEGPDEGGTLYLHGSVAAGWIGRALDDEVCVTVTEVDGLVAGRSGFHHSMNYRSAVVIGRARLVSADDERDRALAAIIDHMIPGRSATLRPASRKELAATVVLAVPLLEASMKVRTGDPVDEPADVAGGVWGGSIPVRRILGAPVSAGDSHDRVPADVVSRAAAPASGGES